MHVTLCAFVNQAFGQVFWEFKLLISSFSDCYITCNFLICNQNIGCG